MPDQNIGTAIGKSLQQTGRELIPFMLAVQAQRQCTDLDQFRRALQLDQLDLSRRRVKVNERSAARADVSLELQKGASRRAEEQLSINQRQQFLKEISATFFPGKAQKPPSSLGGLIAGGLTGVVDPAIGERAQEKQEEIATQKRRAGLPTVKGGAAQFAQALSERTATATEKAAAARAKTKRTVTDFREIGGEQVPVPREVFDESIQPRVDTSAMLQVAAQKEFRTGTDPRRFMQAVGKDFPDINPFIQRALGRDSQPAGGPAAVTTRGGRVPAGEPQQPTTQPKRPPPKGFNSWQEVPTKRLESEVLKIARSVGTGFDSWKPANRNALIKQIRDELLRE